MIGKLLSEDGNGNSHTYGEKTRIPVVKKLAGKGTQFSQVIWF